MGEPDKDKRTSFSPKFLVSVAIAQAFEVLCPLCGEVLSPDEPRTLEHMTPRKLFRRPRDGDRRDNLKFCHKACSDLKTRGCVGTSNKGSVANGDTHRIAKAKRLETARLALGEAAQRRGSIVQFQSTNLRRSPSQDASVCNAETAAGYERPPSPTKFKPKLRGQGFRKDISRCFDGKIRKRKERRPKL